MNPGHQMFNMSKWLIMASGSWRLEVEEKLRLPYKIYTFYIRFLYFCCTLGVFANVFVNIGVNNDQAIESLSLAINNICTTIKMILSMKKNITQLIQVAIEDGAKLADEGPEMEKILFSYNKVIKILNIFMVFYTYGIVTHMAIYGGVFEYYRYQVAHPNETVKPEHVLTFWFPFDPQRHFNIALGIQAFVLIQAGAAGYSCMALFNTMMIYAIVKLKILQHHFRTFDHCSLENESHGISDVEAVASLKKLIKKHQEIIGFVHDLNESIKYALLLEYSISSLMLAAILLQVLNGNKVEIFVPYGMILAFQLFLLSWNADEIRTQSESIAYALYESNWYTHSPKIRRLMHLVVMRSRKELSLNIGPFGPNNVNAAMARMKLAYSYVSVMSQSSL